ncbi:MAG: hypothetical protein RQ748_09285 [Elusimicrobiales bacterium]|nr:hypothetical protein [Elusimicrobiales bacterium]
MSRTGIQFRKGLSRRRARVRTEESAYESGRRVRRTFHYLKGEQLLKASLCLFCITA